MRSSENIEQIKDGNGRLWLILIGALGALSAAVLLAGCFGADVGRMPQEETAVIAGAPAQVSLPAGGPPLAAGDIPYGFTLLDTAGSTVSLHEFIGRPLIINFWATWCAPCRIEMPHLQHTFAAHRDDGLVLLALNQDETIPEIEAYFEELGLSFTPLLDEGGRTAQNYGTGRILPATFFISPAGEITAVHRGPMTQEQIDGYLAETIPASP